MHRGGKGVRIDYRICADDAWLTATYTRSRIPPWPLEGGQAGSSNHIIIRRADGRRDRYSIVSGLALNAGDVIRIMTATGTGWGDPMARERALVMDDLKDGFITAEQDRDVYELHDTVRDKNIPPARGIGWNVFCSYTIAPSASRTVGAGPITQAPSGKAPNISWCACDALNCSLSASLSQFEKCQNWVGSSLDW